MTQALRPRPTTPPTRQPGPASDPATRSSRRGISAFIDRITAGTPADRDRAIDALRALALLGVVVGHWMLGALVLDDSGALTIASPLTSFGALAPASWFLQLLGLFFLVGGYAAALSWTRASDRGLPYWNWLWDRVLRLGRPVIAVAATSALAFAVLASLGVPTATLRTWTVLLVQPLWFVGVYLLVTACTAMASWASRRYGAVPAIGCAVIVGVVDLARYGPWQEAVPSWIGLVNVLPAWLATYHLGVAWALGRLSRSTMWALAVGGVATFAMLLTWFGYPASMVGAPGSDRGNAHPPSLLVVALAFTQSGVAMVLRHRIAALMRRPRLWAGAVVINLSTLSILCWHNVALVATSIGATAVGGVPGLTDAPDSGWWLFARLGWFSVLVIVLAAMVAFALRFDRPWRMPVAGKVVTLGLAGCFAVMATAIV